MAYPLLIASILELHERTARLRDSQVDSCLSKLKEGGATHARTFTTWTNALDLHPFKRNAVGKFELDKENPTWDKTAYRFVKRTRVVGTGNARTLFDNCGLDNRFDCNIFGNNDKGFTSFYDQRFWDQGYGWRWIDRNMNIFGPKRTLWEIYNEASFPDWQDSAKANEWAQKQVVPMWRYILSKNGNRPVMFSAEEPRAWVPPWTGLCDGTASRILGNLSEAGIGGDKIIYSIHGMGSAENWKRVNDLKIISGRPKIVVCDDGVDTQSFNKVPTDRRGACETADFKRCCWDREGRLDMLREAKADRPAQLVGVDWLPREVSMEYKNPSKLIIPLSCSIYKEARKILS